jgi:hypothetical protein
MTRKPQTFTFETSSGDTESLLATLYGENLYRLEESSLLSEANFGDIVEVKCEANGLLRVLQVLTPSSLRVSTWSIPRHLQTSASLQDILGRVSQAGGNWERVFGSTLILHVPLSVEVELTAEMQELLRETHPPTRI